jgi:hypothetical protein
MGRVGPVRAQVMVGGPLTHPGPLMRGVEGGTLELGGMSWGVGPLVSRPVRRNVLYDMAEI